MLSPEFATAMSGLPSPSKSATARIIGPEPTESEDFLHGKTCRGRAPVGVVLSSTEIVLSMALATIISGLPSPLMSAVATERAPIPVAKVCGTAKLAAVACLIIVVLRKTENCVVAIIRDD